ncbi:hypothetical protein WKV44_04510 [Spirochaetia bacterium 38H-sp]|uniref:Alcohol acetyltransferase n=1 Tax=Rarispira pelagica TaxID=3141764 RepID=A0ABU9UAW6_9SPIR
MSNSGRWFRLDNAAKIFPSVISPRRTTLFRVSARMYEPVNLDMLKQALEKTYERFPYYRVRMKTGFFWYYFEECQEIPEIEADSRYPCVWYKNQNPQRFPLRVRVFDRQIAVEMFHSLTDGTGATEFLKTLISLYFNIRYGVQTPPNEGVLLPGDEWLEEEAEDSFSKHYNSSIPKSALPPKAFHVPGKLAEPGVYYITTATIPMAQLKDTAKKLGVTVTVLLTALYFWTFYLIQKTSDKKDKNPIIIQIPVNLRKILDSSSMKNFFLLVFPSIDSRLGEYSFEEILNYVKYYFKLEINKKSILQQIKRNVSSEKNIFARLTPLFIKNIILSKVYESWGDMRATSSLSNMGLIKLPEEIEKYIERFDFYPPPNPTMKVCCTAVAFKDKVNISFGRSIEETTVEKTFFAMLKQYSMNIFVETNYKYEEHKGVML